MKTQKVHTWLPLFSGFYGTIWETDGDEEMEIENINELRKEQGLDPITWDDVDWDSEGYSQAVAEGVTDAVGNELKKRGLIESFKLEKLISPREYNFANDSINVVFAVTPKNQDSIKAYLTAHAKAFESYLKERYTSYDGFISSYSNRLGDWMDNLDSTLADRHQLGSILSFIMERDGQVSEMDIHEELHGNGVFLQASNYSKLVPSVKKVRS